MLLFDSTEDLFRGSEVLKLIIFLPPGNHGVVKENLSFQKTVSPKKSLDMVLLNVSLNSHCKMQSCKEKKEEDEEHTCRKAV